MCKATQLLNYVATQKEAIIAYSASNMVLAVHSNTSYLIDSNARSRAGGHFIMSSNTIHPPNNGAVLNVAQLYIMTRKDIYCIRRTLLVHSWRVCVHR